MVPSLSWKPDRFWYKMARKRRVSAHLDRLGVTFSFLHTRRAVDARPVATPAMHLSLERIFAPERFCASENETGAGQETPLGHRGDCTRGSVAVCSPKCSAVPDLDAVVVTRPAAAPPQPSPCDIRRSIRARPVVSIDPLATRVRIPQPRACKLITACKTFFLCLNVSWRHVGSEPVLVK